MRYLVTGGSGFIGSALIRKILDASDDEVLNVDKLTYASSESTLHEYADRAAYSFARADIADAGAMVEVLDEFEPESVVHLAAESHVDRSIDSPLEFVRTNVLGTAELLKAVQDYLSRSHVGVRERFKFVHVSTDEVFGSLGESGVFDIGTPYDPQSPYAASKAASDHLVSAWHHTYGLPAIISNSSNNYGPFQFPEKFIPLITIRGLLGLPMPVYGDGSNIRDWVYVADHAGALLRICERGEVGGAYLVGARNEQRNLDVATKVCAVLDDIAPLPSGRDHSTLIGLTDDRPGHDYRYAIEPRSTEQLGWSPSTEFEAGLRMTVEWYHDNRSWWEPLVHNSDVIERIGLISTSAHRQ